MLWGDPHITTYDERMYNFPGVCTYIISMDCSSRFVSHVTRFVSHVTRFVGHVTRFVSHVTRFVSHVTRFVGHVTRFVSHVTRFVGHVTRFVGHVTRFVSLSLSLSKWLPVQALPEEKLSHRVSRVQLLLAGSQGLPIYTILILTIG